MRALKSLFRLLILVLRRTGLLALLTSWYEAVGGAAALRRRRAQRYATTLVNELTRLGFSRAIEVGTGKKRRAKRQRVQYAYPLLMTHDELWLPIDIAKLPVGVRTEQLRDPEILQSLEDRLHAPVRMDYLSNQKLCYVVRFAGAAFPAVVPINKMEIDPDAPPLSVPLGVDKLGEWRFFDLQKLKHVLILGATGGGKTTAMHAWLSALIGRNHALQLELWMIDLKGSEFPRYRVLQGTQQQPGLVRFIETETPGALNVLNEAYTEIRRRNEQLRRHDCSDIADLTKRTGLRLPLIVVIIDEFAILTLDKEKIGKATIGATATSLMIKIASLGRSSGVHIVIGTQFINKDVLSGAIRANFENRMTFSTAEWRQSQLAIESSDAVGLPAGRAFARFEGKLEEFQTPLITPQQVRLELSRVAEYGPDGGLGEREEMVQFIKDAKLLLSLACDEFSGDFSRRKLIDHPSVRNVVSKSRFEDIARKLEADGVLVRGRGNKGRIVATGFAGRPDLLDVLYRTGHTGHSAGHSQAAAVPVTSGPERPELHTAHQDAANGNDISGPPVACGPENIATHAHDQPESDDDGPEPEPPDWFRKLDL
jgi:hypothetical protein